MKLADIKKPEFKKPDIKLPKLSKKSFKLSEELTSKLWTGCAAISLACSGIALIVAMF